MHLHDEYQALRGDGGCCGRYIPLQRIGERVLRELEVQRWGECRGTLLGLLAAYNYEAAILAAAARLLTGACPLPAHPPRACPPPHTPPW